MAQVEFFFDLVSPYSYLAHYELQKIVARHKADIIWRPVLLGAILKETGNIAPIQVPAKGRYMLHDLQKWAAHYQLPFQMNPFFPINTVQLMRGALVMQQEGQAAFLHYLDTVYKAMFVAPRNLNDPQEVIATLQDAGLDPALMQKRMAEDEIKNKLRAETEEAVARGVFGAPTFFVNNEMYWGQDRILFVEEALKKDKKI